MLNQSGKQVSHICHFSCHDLGFGVLSSENIHSFSCCTSEPRTLNPLSPEHGGPVARGGQGGGAAAGPRGGRVVEGGQVGDGRGPGHRDDLCRFQDNE